MNQNKQQFTDHSVPFIRVGVLGVIDSENIMDAVGLSGWQKVGGDLVEKALPKEDFRLIRMLVMPKGDHRQIASIMRDWVDTPNEDFRCQLLLTIGNDVENIKNTVIEATKNIIDYELIGIADHLRLLADQQYTQKDEDSGIPRPESTRGMVGVRKSCLIVNLPSSFRNPGEATIAMLPLLPSLFDQVSQH